ncbi:Multisubstrate pseudouridine synthase 7 [Cladobotryum mycophilum]|uniref:Multisubstrate pseudouridine synthase 7 n=1 Tax=Cladobotryum mycophilum TaxID=491253 RepID=A0ABR0SE79_9HYPO
MAEQAHYNVRQSASYAKTLGITQRATPLEFPWVGDLRVRFSDFQVNEIGKNGSVIHLRKIGLGGDVKVNESIPMRRIELMLGQTNQGEPSKEDDTPKEPQEPVDDKESNEATEPPQETEPLEISAEDVTVLENLTDPKFAQELVQLFKTIQGEDAEKRKYVTSDLIDDKYKRGQIHQEVRRIFKSKIDTTTNGNDAIVANLVAPLRRGKKRGRGGRNHKRAEPKPIGGEYLHFTLFKDNRDTMDAVSQIARILRVKPQVIGYAGTKDRRASTVQRCSVRYTRDRSLAGLNGRLWGITTGDYEYKEEPIHLGELLGNEFAITIKNCEVIGDTSAKTVSEKLDFIRSNVQSALDHMAEHGWINYFGHQRFGTHQIGTHQIGRLILADRFEDAVNSILAYDDEIAQRAEMTEEAPEPSKRDEYARHQACMLFKTGKDVEKAIEIMPRRFTAEGCVMRHLNRQGSQSRRDFVGAVIHITRGLRSMYLHAYQSHVWNHAASKRWESHGEKVIKGDLVIVEAEAIPQVSGQDQDGDDIVNPVVEDDDDAAPVRARPLSEEEAASGQYTIHDVVLPTPGYDVIYPENEIGDFYREFMGGEENGSLDPHKMRRLRREFSLPGRYRKLMHTFLAKPSIEFKAYANEEEQMHPTDLDLIKATTTTTTSKPQGKRERNEEEDERPSKIAKDAEQDAEQEDAPPPPSSTQDKPSGDVGEPTKIAAVVKFQLGRSAYATVTLRELMGDPPEGTSSREAGI